LKLSKIFINFRRSFYQTERTNCDVYIQDGLPWEPVVNAGLFLTCQF